MNCASRCPASAPGLAGWMVMMAVVAMPARSTGVGSTPPGRDCTVARYAVTLLPLKPAAINEGGEVAGATDAHHAAVWSARRGIRELPVPPGFVHSEAVAINRHGEVAGMVYDQDYTTHRAFKYSHGATLLLDGVNARAFDITDSGDVAGDAVLPGSVRSQPVIWSHGRLRVLDSCCGGFVRRLDPKGAIGDAYDEAGQIYAYRWTESQGMRRIGPPDQRSSALAANVEGHAVIAVLRRLYLYADDALTELARPRRTSPQPYSINRCDRVVGASGPFLDSAHAFVWDKTTGFQDLNRQIPEATGWKLHSATAQNDAGQIVGFGDPPGGEDGGFLLTPK